MLLPKIKEYVKEFFALTYKLFYKKMPYLVNKKVSSHLHDGNTAQNHQQFKDV